MKYEPGSSVQATGADTSTCIYSHSTWPHTSEHVSFQTEINVSVKRIAGEKKVLFWCVGPIEPGLGWWRWWWWGGGHPAIARLNTVISPAKLSWPELNPPPSQLGVGGSFTAQAVLLPPATTHTHTHSPPQPPPPPLPAVGLLQAAFCWPAAFFHTSAVCEESCVSILPSFHPSFLQSSSSCHAFPSTHPPTQPPGGGAGGSLPWQLVKSPN